MINDWVNYENTILNIEKNKFNKNSLPKYIEFNIKLCDIISTYPLLIKKQ